VDKERKKGEKRYRKNSQAKTKNHCDIKMMLKWFQNGYKIHFLIHFKVILTLS